MYRGVKLDRTSPFSRTCVNLECSSPFFTYTRYVFDPTLTSDGILNLCHETVNVSHKIRVQPTLSLSAASLCDFYLSWLADIHIKFRYPSQVSATAISHTTKFPAGDIASVLTNRCSKPIWNRIKFRVVTGLLTRYNTLRKSLYIIGLIDSFLRRRRGTAEKFRSHFVWVWSFGDTQTHSSGFLFLGPCWCYNSNSGGNLNRATMTWISVKRLHRACQKPTCIGTQRARTQ
jgi:hypothetical protein